MPPAHHNPHIMSRTSQQDKLGAQDRVSIVLFSDYACAPKPLGSVGCADLAALKAAVQVRMRCAYA